MATRESVTNALRDVGAELKFCRERLEALIDRISGHPPSENAEVRSDYAALVHDEKMDLPEGHNEDSPYTSLRIQFRAAVVPIFDLISRAEEALVLTAAQSENRRRLLGTFRELPFVKNLDRIVDTDPFRTLSGLDAVLKVLGDAAKSTASLERRKVRVQKIRKDKQASTTNESESPGTTPSKRYKTAMGRNIDRLRLECGWGLATLAKETGIDKKRILAHINAGSGAHPSTLKTYADAFTRAMKREVTVAELVS